MAFAISQGGAFLFAILERSMRKQTTSFTGVNLGGWFVLERWLTPELFDGTEARDMYCFMQTPGAAKKLKHHLKTFITEADFRWLRDNDVTHVRLPVGYWVLEDDEPFTQARARLDWAFSMAKKYDIQLLLCLHAAPGSQNGNDHSGRIGLARWYTTERYRDKTLESLVALAERYGRHDQLWGIELLNEPKMKVFQRKLRCFYRASYEELDPLLKNDAYIVFSDAFSPRRLSGALRGRSRSVMDVHWYHFTAPTILPLRLYFWLVRTHGYLLRQLRWQQPVIVGEWASVLMHKKLPDDPGKRKALIKRHIELQQRAYEQALGSFYWTYKMQGEGGWNFRHMVESGELIIPKR